MTNRKEVECPKCRGKGRLEWAIHRDEGRCFQCGGAGTVMAATINLAPNEIRNPALHAFLIEYADRCDEVSEIYRVYREDCYMLGDKDMARCREIYRQRVLAA